MFFTLFWDIMPVMTAEEKQVLYDLLNAADSYVNGTPADCFARLAFADDAPPAAAQGDFTAQKAAHLAETPGDETGIEAIAHKIAACTRCGLAKTRKNTVPGVGSPQPLVLVIGEGPGAEEDARGEPFVGKAGQLLDKMLAAISLSRGKNCFIANVVKCRPPQNRDPLPEESAACASFLQAQIQVLRPRLILAAGRVAVQNLLETKEGIGRLRGKFLDYKGIPLMATYHPSALLRDEALKRPAWEDLKLFRSRLLELEPSYEEDFKS